MKTRRLLQKAQVAMPPLRCPGGPRLSAMGLKTLFHAPNAGYLAKNDQRFILNLKLTHQIMAHLSKTNKTNDKLLVELGPGAGALTRSLLTRPCAGVLGIEVDPRFNPLLQQIHNQTDGKFKWKNGNILELDEFEVIREFYPEFVALHERKRPEEQTIGERQARGFGDGDAPLKNKRREELLRKRKRSSKESVDNNDKVDVAESHIASSGMEWWANGTAKVELIANLPFSIITELLMRYSVDCSRQQGVFRFGRVPLHAFVQKEIAERLTAAPNSPQFSRLSVLAQNFFRVVVRQTFTEMTFYPKTEILGCLVTLEPRMAPLVEVDAAVVIRFNDIVLKPGQRSGMLVKALQRCVPPEVALYMLQELRIDGAVLPSQLTTQEVAQMALLWQRFLEATNQKLDEKYANGKRPHVSEESKTLDFDWEREERYARRKQQEEEAAKEKPKAAN